MIVKHNKKYAVIPVSHIAVPIENLPAVLNEVVVLHKNYDSSVHTWQYVLQNVQSMAVDIVEGEQIIADSASHRMLQEKS